jgi:hypothetical protein
MDSNSNASQRGTFDMGLPRRRDPDALPPGNVLEAFGGLIYYVLSGLGRGNAVYALKSGVLTSECCLTRFSIGSNRWLMKSYLLIHIAALSLASFLPSSAGYAFGELVEKMSHLRV